MVQLIRSSFRIRSEFHRFLLSFNVIVYVDIMVNQKSIPLQQKKNGHKDSEKYGQINRSRKKSSQMDVRLNNNYT